MTTLGRPMKGKTRRIPYTIHLEEETVAAIDAYAEERSQEEGKAYSRSDFLNTAAESLLRSLGKLPEGGDKE
ncbi:MAG: hypothetical protein RR365_00835 [Bacteroides sp.]